MDKPFKRTQIHVLSYISDQEIVPGRKIKYTAFFFTIRINLFQSRYSEKSFILFFRFQFQFSFSYEN